MGYMNSVPQSNMSSPQMGYQSGGFENRAAGAGQWNSQTGSYSQQNNSPNSSPYQTWAMVGDTEMQNAVGPQNWNTNNGEYYNQNSNAA